MVLLVIGLWNGWDVHLTLGFATAGKSQTSYLMVLSSLVGYLLLW